MLTPPHSSRPTRRLPGGGPEDVDNMLALPMPPPAPSGGLKPMLAASAKQRGRPAPLRTALNAEHSAYSVGELEVPEQSGAQALGEENESPAVSPMALRGMAAEAAKVLSPQAPRHPHDAIRMQLEALEAEEEEVAKGRQSPAVSQGLQTQNPWLLMQPAFGSQASSQSLSRVKSPQQHITRVASPRSPPMMQSWEAPRAGAGDSSYLHGAAREITEEEALAAAAKAPPPAAAATAAEAGGKQGGAEAQSQLVEEELAAMMAAAEGSPPLRVPSQAVSQPPEEVPHEDDVLVLDPPKAAAALDRASTTGAAQEAWAHKPGPSDGAQRKQRQRPSPLEPPQEIEMESRTKSPATLVPPAGHGFDDDSDEDGDKQLVLGGDDAPEHGAGAGIPGAVEGEDEEEDVTALGHPPAVPGQASTSSALPNRPRPRKRSPQDTAAAAAAQAEQEEEAAVGSDSSPTKHRLARPQASPVRRVQAKPKPEPVIPPRPALLSRTRPSALPHVSAGGATPPTGSSRGSMGGMDDDMRPASRAVPEIAPMPGRQAPTVQAPQY